jgi:hypothetical protein
MPTATHTIIETDLWNGRDCIYYDSHVGARELLVAYLFLRQGNLDGALVVIARMIHTFDKLENEIPLLDQVAKAQFKEVEKSA